MCKAQHQLLLNEQVATAAKSMVTLASKSVLSEYWSSKVGQYSYGKLRVRGVQIRGDLSKVLNRCDVYV